MRKKRVVALVILGVAPILGVSLKLGGLDWWNSCLLTLMGILSGISLILLDNLEMI